MRIADLLKNKSTLDETNKENYRTLNHRLKVDKKCQTKTDA